MMSTHSLTARGSNRDLPFHTRATTNSERVERAWLLLRMSRILFAAKTDLDGITHEQTTICRQLFAGHVAGSQPMKMGEKNHRMIIKIIVTVVTLMISKII